MISNLADLTAAVQANTDAVNALVAQGGTSTPDTIPQETIDQINANTTAVNGLLQAPPTTLPPGASPIKRAVTAPAAPTPRKDY